MVTIYERAASQPKGEATPFTACGTGTCAPLKSVGWFDPQTPLMQIADAETGLPETGGARMGQGLAAGGEIEPACGCQVSERISRDSCSGAGGLGALSTPVEQVAILQPAARVTCDIEAVIGRPQPFDTTAAREDGVPGAGGADMTLPAARHHTGESLVGQGSTSPQDPEKERLFSSDGNGDVRSRPGYGTRFGGESAGEQKGVPAAAEGTPGGRSGQDAAHKALTGGEGFDSCTAAQGDRMPDFNTVAAFDLRNGLRARRGTAAFLNGYNAGNLSGNQAVRASHAAAGSRSPRQGRQADGLPDSHGPLRGYCNSFTPGADRRGLSAGRDKLTCDTSNIASVSAETVITTPAGGCCAGALRVGDLVSTLDAGSQPLLWVGGKNVPAAELARVPHLQPVLIPKGALGRGLPQMDLLVSGRHRLYFGGDAGGLGGGLVAARLLVGQAGIRRVIPPKGIHYVQLLLGRHQLLQAEGALTECFHPGPKALRLLSATDRARIEALLPGLRRGPLLQPVRPVLRGNAARELAAASLAQGGAGPVVRAV